MEKEEGGSFEKSRIFSYNLWNKRRFVFFAILIAVVLILFSLYYFFGLRDSEFFLIQWTNAFVNNITSEIAALTLLGAFYAALFGGLFFIPSPTEVIFIAFVVKLNPILLILIFMIGTIISYELNYFIGLKLSELSKRVIGYKQFYKFKGFTNKYGMWTIFLFNLLPLPSQPLATILGVFRYNRGKFYIAFISGELLKFIVIAIAYVYFF